MRTSDKIDEVAKSVYAVHRDLANPPKDSSGPVRGGKAIRYASLPAIIDHARKALKDASVAIIQEIEGSERGGVLVTTTFLHLGGQFIELGPTFVPSGNDPQAYGSAVTYARRYALAAALGIAADDDDDAASAKVEPRSTVTGSSEATGMAEADGSGAPASGPTSGAGVSDEDRGEGSTTQTSALLITPEQIDVLKQAAGGVQKARAASKESYGKDWRELTADEGLELIQRLQQINQAAEAVG